MSQSELPIRKPSKSSESGGRTLKAGSVGGLGLTFMVVACAAPLTVVVGVPGLIWGVAGNAAPAAAFVASGLVLLVFSVGYTAMSRYLSGPGGFAVYVDRAFGRKMSGAASFVALVGYGGFLIALVGFLGYLAAPEFSSSFGLDLPWWIWSIIATIVIGILGYFNVNLSAAILAVLLTAEVLVTIVMDIAIIIKGGPSGFTFASLSPKTLFTASPAIAILFAVASYVGFESTTLYGEEVKNRSKTVPRATYAAVILITVFYCFTFWAMGVGYGTSALEVAQKNPGTFTFDLASKFAGQPVSDAMNWLVLTSVLAASLAFHNGFARYMFSLGRSGILHHALGKPHRRHGSPHVASVTSSIVTVIAVVIYAIAKGDPYLQMYSWWVAIGTVAMLLLYSSGGISVLRFLRANSHVGNLWQTVIAPGLSSLALVVLLVATIVSFSTVTGSSNGAVNLLWVLAPIVAVLGYFLARAHYARHPDAPSASLVEEEA